MNVLKKVLIGILIIIAIPAVCFCVILAFITINEYKPKDVEEVEPSHNEQVLNTEGNSYTIITWNIGYGGLDNEEDFFMDGGKSVLPDSAEGVDENIAGIQETINSISPDFALLQEVDKCSKRSFKRDEVKIISEGMPSYSNVYTDNYKVSYIPYPWPTLGKVEGGLLTLSGYNIESATRVALPCPFKWPSRVANLKRCLLVSRMPVGDTGKELVLVNLHLEAYDSGEGKVLQTALLKEYLENEVEKGNYVIAGGDFNQTFSNIDISKYPTYEGNWQPGIMDAETFEGNFQICMSSNAPSCRSLAVPYKDSDPSVFQFYVIDGFLVSKNIDIEELYVEDCNFEFSDHNPLVMKFKISE